MQYGLGYIEDDPDPRDQLFSAPFAVGELPPRVDLRPGIKLPPYNQSTLGSCTGQAIAKCLEFVRGKQGLEVFKPSPLFIYYNERVLEGTVRRDVGAQIRNGLKSIALSGVCPEEDWPYEIKKFAVSPTNKAYANALIHRAIDYSRLSVSVNQMRACLADGYPFVGGIKVYSSFENVSHSGHVPMPTRRDGLLGGHALSYFGYDDEMVVDGQKGAFIGCNSWSVQWGDKGFFYIPYAYLTDSGLSSDYWTIRLTV